MPALSDDGKMEWDPSGGPNGTGAWVPRQDPNAVASTFTTPTGAPVQSSLNPTFSSGAWGHQGDALDENGNPIAGSNGMAVDRNRYREMGQHPQNPLGPQIDRTASNESRGMSMGALGLLGARAHGEETPAQRLAAQQTTGAVNGLQSGAASVKGGAMARAAASRGAVAGGARLQAQGDQDAQALRAREMADASGQYFGATTGQRGADLGVATSQAQLEAGQRSSNDQREGFYEGLAQDTQKANIDHQLGRSEGDAAAAASAAANQAQRDQAASASRQQALNTAVGAGTGLGQGVAAAYGSGDKKDADPDPYSTAVSTSDERAKEGVKPMGATASARTRAKARMGDADAQKLRDTAANMMTGMQTNLAAGPAVGGAPAAPGEPEGAMAKAALDDAIGSRVAQDNAPRYGYFSPKQGGSQDPVKVAPTGYADSRKGKPGYMFGPAPSAHYDSLRSADDGGPHDDPSAASSYATKAPRGEFLRDVAMSDPAAKRAAFVEGLNHANEARDTGKIGPVPDYVQDGPNFHDPEQVKRSSVVKRQPFGEKGNEHKAVSSVERADPAPQRRNNAVSETNQSRADMLELAGGGIGTAAAGAMRSKEADYERSRMMSPPPSLMSKAPDAIADTLSRAYPDQSDGPISMSDEKTKRGFNGSAMHDANLSMAPSSYEYKPGFAAAEGQKPGEVNVGPMANNMEADPVAKTAIVKDPQSGLLGIDKTKGLKLVMGGLADVQAQVDQLKKQKRAAP